MRVFVVFICIFFSFGLNVLTVVSQTAIASSEQSCLFSDMIVLQTLEIDTEKYGNHLEVLWSPQDDYLATGTFHDNLELNNQPNLFTVLNTITWEPVLNFELPSDYYAQSISWSPDGRYVAIYYQDHLIAWDTSTWNHTEITVPEVSIYRIAWTNNNNLITLSDTGAWVGTEIRPYGNVSRLWNVIDGTLIHDFSVLGVQSEIVQVGDQWLIVINDGNVLSAYYMDDPEQILVQLENMQLANIAVTEDTVLLLTSTKSETETTLQVWDILEERKILDVSGTEYTGTGGFLNAGAFLLLHQLNKSDQVWDIEAQHAFPTLNIDRKDYGDVRADWSMTTMCAAAYLYPSDADRSEMIYLLDIANGELVAELEGHKRDYLIARIDLSNNGEWLASTSSDGALIIWQAQE